MSGDGQQSVRQQPARSGDAALAAGPLAAGPLAVAQQGAVQQELKLPAGRDGTPRVERALPGRAGSVRVALTVLRVAWARWGSGAGGAFVFCGALPWLPHGEEHAQRVPDGARPLLRLPLPRAAQHQAVGPDGGPREPNVDVPGGPRGEGKYMIQLQNMIQIMSNEEVDHRNDHTM